MIDFVKLRINDSDLKSRLINNENLTFIRRRGRLVSNKNRDLVFKICDSGTVEITGSLHKYFNNGVHNWNDFSRVNLWDTIQDLCEWLQISPSKAKLHNLEFGVNLTVPFPPKDLLTDLIAYKGKSFGRVSVPSDGNYFQVEVSDYLIKCYDKGAHYGRENYILRFEVKVKKMRVLEDVGIKTLQDLQNTKLNKLKNLLVQAWNYVLIREKLPQDELTVKERKLWNCATNSSLIKSMSPQDRHAVRVKYTELIEKYSLGGQGIYNRKKVVEKLIIGKWDQLIKWNECTDLQNGCEDSENERLHHSGIRCNRPQTRTCKITSANITGQKSNSSFISAKTLKDHPELVDLSKLKFRKGKRLHNHPEEYYLAHNIRNMDSNERKNLKRRLNKILNTQQLFPAEQTIRLTAKQKDVLGDHYTLQTFMINHSGN